MRLPVYIGAHRSFAVICEAHSLVVTWLVGGKILRPTTRTKNSEPTAGFSKKANKRTFEGEDLLCVAYFNPQGRSDPRRPTRPNNDLPAAAMKAAEREITILVWLI